MVSLEEQPLVNSFNKVFLGAAGTSGEASDDQFNRTSFLSHFEGSNNGVNNAFDDASASNHTISAQGSATQGSFGPFARPDGEWGVSFDGAGDYLTVTDSTEFDLGDGNFTIEGWINPANVAGYKGIFSIGNPVQIYSYNNSIIAYFNDGDNASSYIINNLSGPSSSVSANTWAHFAVVRNGNTYTAYVNGVAGSSLTSSATVASSSSAPAIGTYLPAPTTYQFDGHISNLRLVKGTAVYTSNFTPSTSKLTAITNTKLLSCQSNRFIDNSASGHAITPTGTPSVTAFGPFLTSSVYDPAVNGASAYIAARADGINIADSSEFNMTGEFSVEFWVYLISNDAEGIDIMFRGYGNGQNTQIGYEPSNRHLYLYNDANPVTSSTDMHINSWNHIACCRTSSTTSIFLNGVRVGTASYSTAVDWGGGTTQLMAYGTGAYSPAGYATDLRLLKGSSAYDATASTLTVPTAPLTAITNTKLLLNMADGQAIDSAAQNNLTLYGTAKTSTAQKKFGTASLLLDGNSDYVRLNTGFNMAAGDFTFEMFVRLNAIDVGQTLFDTRPDSTNGLYHQLYIHSGNRIIYVVSGAGKIDAAANTLNLATGTWYHIALCRSGTSTKLFLDRTQKGSTYSDSTVYLNSGKCVIGVSSYGNSGNWGNYYMDDFRASNLARYTSNFTAPAEPFADKGQ